MFSTPADPNTLWVGTGENVGGRHVSFGDGIYRSTDAGKTWKNLGLKKTEHISEIIVDPRDSNVVWVAAQGPLWSKGGERGLFKTTDGGKTWKNVLKKGPWTGVTSIVMDPRDSDVVYAATWQHHRTVAAYMGGGPESGLYRTTDGAETWQPLKVGLPNKTMGKIALAISPLQPDVVYASIELHRMKGAVYRSSNRGQSWVKGAEVAPGGTGPTLLPGALRKPARVRPPVLRRRVATDDDGRRQDVQGAAQHHQAQRPPRHRVPAR